MTNKNKTDLDVKVFDICVSLAPTSVTSGQFSNYMFDRWWGNDPDTSSEPNTGAEPRCVKKIYQHIEYRIHIIHILHTAV